MIKKITYLFSILSLILFCSFFKLDDFFSKKTITYEETTAGKTIKTIWTIKSKDKDLLITATNQSGITKIDCTKEYHINTFSYNTHDEKTKYVIKKENGKLIAEGTLDGNKEKKEYDIGELAWIQDFGYGLIPFLKSSKKELEFAIISPKDFDMHKLLTEKDLIEKIEVNGKEYNCRKLTITLPGIKGMFWSAQIWFDIKTDQFIKYTGNSGPNTPITTILLKS